jgi:hypothetical protein
VRFAEKVARRQHQRRSRLVVAGLLAVLALNHVAEALLCRL